MTLRDIRFGLSALVLALALLLGGSRQPMTLMAIEIAALLLILLCCATFDRADWRVSRLAWIAAILVALVGMSQLVPLPASVWRGLPGRGFYATVTDLAGLSTLARPLSLDPDATWATLLAVLPAIAMAAAAFAARPEDHARLATVVIGMACLSALVGVAQVTGGNDFYPYAITHYGYPVGLFANRNHEADLLLIAMLLLAGKAGRRPRSRRAPRGNLRSLQLGLMLLLAIAVVTTGSRVGTAILPFALLGALLIAIVRPGAGLWKLFAIIVALGIGATLLILFNPAVQAVIARYGSISDDGRFTYWHDTLIAIGQFWPMGSGLGTFVPVYQSLEQLDTVTPAIVNHAHNDYLEILLETGAAGAVLLVLYFGALGHGLWRGSRGGAQPAWIAATLALLVLLAHSLADYPLRTPALMTVFGLLNGMVLRDSIAALQQRRSTVP